MANNVCNFVNEHRYFVEAQHEFEDQGGGDSIVAGLFLMICAPPSLCGELCRQELNDRPSFAAA